MQQGFKDGGLASLEIQEAYLKYKDTFDYKLNKHSITQKAFKICLIDVNSGSDTKLMVKQVLDWAKKYQTIENDMFSNDICSSLN